MQPFSSTTAATDRQATGRRLHIRFALVRALLGVFPAYSLNRTRLLALKACGLRAGRGTLFWGMPRFALSGAMGSRLHIDAHCGFNEGCLFDLAADIHIAPYVNVGHEVKFLTSVHAGGTAAAPIRIEEGVWLGTRCTVHGGVTIGQGAVVGAATVVSRDIPPNTLATGDRLIPLPRWVSTPADAQMPEADARYLHHGTAGPRPKLSLGFRLKDAWSVEFSNLRWRVLALTLMARMFRGPRTSRLRARLLAAMGVDIGRGTRLAQMPVIQSVRPGSLRGRLHIGSECTLGRQVILEFGALLTLGDRVTVEDGVVILTTTHQLGPPGNRAWRPTRSPVSIADDARLGANAIILPGVTIGARARVLPGSVVNASVAPDTTVGGSPARPVRMD